MNRASNICQGLLKPATKLQIENCKLQIDRAGLIWTGRTNRAFLEKVATFI